MKKNKFCCDECIHANVCEWFPNPDTKCSGFLSEKTYDMSYDMGYLQGIKEGKKCLAINLVATLIDTYDIEIDGLKEGDVSRETK